MSTIHSNNPIWIRQSNVYSGLYQTSKIDRFAKIGTGFKPLTIFAKRSILDVWQGSEYVSDDYTNAGLLNLMITMKLLKFSAKSTECTHSKFF